MFKQDRREIFSFRKYKNGRTDSKLIGATILALGVGLVTTTQSVSADVVNGAGGSEVALVDSVDKTTSTNTNTFTDDTDTSKVAKFDAVLNKGVAEPTKANENKGDADGTDTVTVTSETTVNYKLEEDKSLLKTETVATGQGTIKTPYDKKGLAADTDGKDYRESTADKSGITVSEETGKQDTLELNDKVYERTRSEVEGADKAKYSKTQFNDIEASVSPEGMHNKLGEIDYTKTTGKVYLVEETADGQYGKFVETTGVSSDEDAVSKWKAGLANAKDFTKANVTLQEGDSILVLDKDTYAVGNSKTIKNVKRYNGFTFGFAENSVDVDRNTSFDNPTYSLAQNGSGESANILEAGADGIFGTADDVRKTVDKNELFDFEDGGEWLSESIKEDLKPFFDYKDYVPLDPSTNPTLATAIKKQKMYNRIYQILDFAQNEATSPEDKAKVVETKAKLDSYLEGVAAKLAENGVKLAYLTENTASGSVKKGYYLTGDTGGFIISDEARDLISPNGTGVSKILDGLTFSNLKETTSKVDTVEGVTSVHKEYTLHGDGGFDVVTTTTKKFTHLINKNETSSSEPEIQTIDSEYSELLKSGNVKVNDDGSVTITTKETVPSTKFYKVSSGDSEDVDDPNKELQPSSDGLFHITQEDREREDLSGFKVVSESSHNETTYNKREIITPIRAYKVVADGTSTVTHYYRLKKAPLNVNYYLENTTTSLAPSENQADLPVKSDYTTQFKEIPSKTEVQDLPEKTVTTVTTYELVATPDNANGKIAEGGTTVNYFYRAVVKTTEVAKQAPVTANYYLEGTTDKLAPSDEQGQKDIGSAYTTETKTITPKVVTQDLEDRVITTTTTYELISEPIDKNGNVPVGGKVVNYFYRAVVKENVVMKQAPVTINYFKEGTTEKLAPSDDQGEKVIGTTYTSETKTIEPKVEVQDFADRTVTKTTTYELVEQPNNKEGKVPVGGTTVNYYYRPVVKEDVVMKKAPVIVNYYLEGTATKLADSDDQGQKEIGSKYTSETKVIEPKVEVEELPNKTITKTTTYELVAVPEDKEGTVPVEGKVVNYYYRPVVSTTETPKQAPVIVHHLLEGTTEKLADDENQGLKNIDSNYTTNSANIPPKVEVQDLEDRVVTKTTTYELVSEPTDKTGTVPPEGKEVTYYYRPIVKEDVVKKQAPVVVNHYEDGTTIKLVDSVDKGKFDIGSGYTTESAIIPPKVEVQELPNKTVTTTTTWTLKEEPSDKTGTVPSEGKVVNYYYVKNVKVTEVPKQASVVVNYYKDGTTEKLSPSDDRGLKDIDSKYTTEKRDIPPVVEVEETPEKTITKTTTWVLKEVPKDAEGIVPVEGKVVDYYYVPKVTVEEVKKQAPVTVNYYKDGTTESLVPSENQGKKEIGSKYTTEPKVVPSVVTVEETPEKTITTTTKWVLKAVPKDKDGDVPVGGKVVNYYYVKEVDVKETKKQAPVIVNYYKEGTTTSVSPSENLGKHDIGGTYTTEPKTIPPVATVEETPEKRITKTVTYELVKVPEDKDGKVPSEGKVVNYYYKEVVKVDEIRKRSSIVVHHYLEGTTIPLSPSSSQTDLGVGTSYRTESRNIPNKVEYSKVGNKEVVTTTTYELVSEPTNKVGSIVPTETVVTYYYHPVVVTEEYPTVPNDAPKVEVPSYDEPIGTIPNDAPKVDIPEYTEPIGVPGTPEVHEKPEFEGGVTPLDPPVVEIPEYTEPIGTIPNDTPKVEIPSYTVPIEHSNISEVPEKPNYDKPIKPTPNDVPNLEVPELKVPDKGEKSKIPNTPVTSTTTVITDVTPQQVETPKAELPNTGLEDSSGLAALGLVGLFSSLGLTTKLRNKD